MALQRGAPPEKLIGDDYDSDGDKMCKSFHSIFAQHNKAQGQPKAKYPKTKDGMAADKRKKEWKKARGKLSANAVDHMFQLALKDHTLFKVDPRQIDYADVPMESDLYTERLLKAINTSNHDLLFLGFDTEGDLDVLQIYAKINDYERALIFQLNFIAVQGKLPEGLVQILTHPCVVFIGKLVELEAVALFEKFGIEHDPQSRIKYVDILDLIRVCDLFSRSSLDDAICFAGGGEFKPTQAERGIKHDALGNAGVRAGMSYFTDFVIDKRVRHVHPHQVDWSRQDKAAQNKLQMTDTMKGYCTADAKAPFLMLLAAAKLTRFTPSDFVRLARLSPKIGSPKEFINGKMELVFTSFKRNSPTPEISSLQNEIRAHHQERLCLESEWQRERRAFYVAERDPWRRAHGYREVLDSDDNDPFRPGGIWDLILKPHVASLLSPTPAAASTPSTAPIPVAASTSSAAPTPDATSIRSPTPTPVTASITATTLTAASALIAFSTPAPDSPDAAASALATPETPSSPPAALSSTAVEDLVLVDEWSMDTESPYSPSRPTPTSPLLLQQPPQQTPQQQPQQLPPLQQPSQQQPPPQQQQQQPPLQQPPPQQQQQQPPLQQPSQQQQPRQQLQPPEPNVPKSWKDDVFNISNVNKLSAGKFFERIVEAEEDEEVLLRRLIYVLQAQEPSHCRNIGPIAFTRVPFRISQRFAIQLIQGKLIHHSYLHTLSLLSYGELPGEVMLDQLTQPDSDSHFLEDYLTLVTPDQVSQMVSFATPLVLDDPHIIKAKMANCTPFPLDYVEREEALKSFSPARLAKLISTVCRAKDIELPRLIKLILFEEFSDHLIKQLNEKYVFTNDFVVMVREALVRLQLETELAVSFFAAKIPELAIYFAAQAGLPVPVIPSDSLKIPFVNSVCTEDHTRTSRSMLGCGEIIINNDCTLGVLRRELGESDFITLIHHEPPLRMPYADPIDMITIRTKNFAFHVFEKPSPFHFRATIDLLKVFEQGNHIYSWSPAGLLKILCDRFGWIPYLVDLKPRMNEFFEKDNVTLSDLSRRLYHAPLCWRARTFSAHVRPSLLATTHRAIVASIINKAAIRFIRNPNMLQMLNEEMTQEEVVFSQDVEDQVEEHQPVERVIIRDSKRPLQEGEPQDRNDGQRDDGQRDDSHRDGGHRDDNNCDEGHRDDGQHDEMANTSRPNSSSASVPQPRRRNSKSRSSPRRRDSPQPHRRDDSRSRPGRSYGSTPDSHSRDKRDSARPKRDYRSPLRRISDKVSTSDSKRRRH